MQAGNESAFAKFIKFWTDLVEKPVLWFREIVVVPNRKVYPWYHEKLRRVPTVDECYSDDVVCIFEATQQFYRDRKVDGNIVEILKRRFDNCSIENKPDDKEICYPLYVNWQNAVTNFFIKYGDLTTHSDARDAYMKQKHRMIWERRHGPVGSGMRNTQEHSELETEREEFSS